MPIKQLKTFPKEGERFPSLEAFRLSVLLTADKQGIALYQVDPPTSTTRATFRCTTKATPTSLACTCHIQGGCTGEGDVVVTSRNASHSVGCKNGAMGTKTQNRLALRGIITALKKMVKDQEEGQAEMNEEEEGDDSSEEEKKESMQDEQALAFRALRAAEDGPFPSKQRLQPEIEQQIRSNKVYEPSPLSAFRTSRDLAVAVWAWAQSNDLALVRLGGAKALFKLSCGKSRNCSFKLEAEEDTHGLWRFSQLELRHDHSTLLQVEPPKSSGSSPTQQNSPLSLTRPIKRCSSSPPVPSPAAQRRRLDPSPSTASTCTSLFASSASSSRTASTSTTAADNLSSSSSESFVTLLPSFLAGVFPLIPEKERVSLAAAILDSGIDSIDFLATLLVLEEVSVRTLFRAVERRKEQEKEGEIERKAFETGLEMMREAYEKESVA